MLLLLLTWFYHSIFFIFCEGVEENKNNLNNKKISKLLEIRNAKVSIFLLIIKMLLKILFHFSIHYVMNILNLQLFCALIISKVEIRSGLKDNINAHKFRTFMFWLSSQRVFSCKVIFVSFDTIQWIWKIE